MAGFFSEVFDAVKSLFTSDGKDLFLEDEIRIVLTGKTGEGKSETGNTILGQQKFKSSSSGDSVTKKCKLEESVRENKRIVVVDTPGFFDTSTSQEDTRREVAKCIGLTSPGPHCFLLVLAVGRFTPEDKNTVETVFKLFGNDVQKYVIIIFTKLDSIPMKGKLKDKLEEYLKDVPRELKSFLDRCEHRCVAFNNTASAKRRAKQFKELLHLIEETVKTNGGLHYTSEMFEQAEKLIQTEIEEEKRKAMEEEQKLREQKDKENELKIKLEMAKAKECEIEKKLEEERKKLDEEREKLKEEQKSLDDSKRKKDEYERRHVVRQKIEDGEVSTGAKIMDGISKVILEVGNLAAKAAPIAVAVVGAVFNYKCKVLKYNKDNEK